MERKVTEEEAVCAKLKEEWKEKITIGWISLKKPYTCFPTKLQSLHSSEETEEIPIIKLPATDL